MMFRVNKALVAANAASTARSRIQYTMSQLNSSPMSSFSIHISQAIQEGIEAAIESLIKDIYTDAEFEEDMGLRNKT